LKFSKISLNNVYVIEVEKLNDKRGFFARCWDEDLFKQHNLNPKIIQCSISYNKLKGTLRGMHYQIVPYEEAKLIRCTKGKAFVAIIDLNQKSKTCLKWVGIELNENEHKLIYIPEGCAVGFQTLEDNTEIFYQISQKYMPEYARGIRWDDKTFNISWPLTPTVISKKDQSFEIFKKIN